MTHAEFCALQEQTGLSNRALAEIADIDERMVRNWRTGRSTVSPWVADWLPQLAVRLAPLTVELHQAEAALMAIEARRAEVIQAVPPPAAAQNGVTRLRSTRGT